jgi:two-component system, response regulator PdtaR
MRVLRVLLIEDEAMIAMLLTEVIDQMGHVVCAVAATEDDAIAAGARCQPDLMIVDEMLRKGSGVSAVREILRSGPVPHVFVSGESLEDQTLSPNAVVISKPFSILELARAIQRALGATGVSPANPAV